MLTNRKQSWKFLAQWWLTKVEKLHSTQGPIQTIKLIKSARLHVTRFLCGEPLFQPPIPCMGINRKGLPKLIGPLQELLYGDFWDKRFLMTLLVISKTIKGHKKPDHSSITTPLTGEITNSLLKEIREVIPKWFKPIVTEWEDFHLTTKMGPNGQALISSTLDLKYLSKQQLEDILIIAGEKLSQVIDINRRWLSLKDYGKIFKTNDRGSTRNISYVYDPEAKVRVIAILDYWTQTALENLSKGIFNLLRQFPSDCTFDQGSRLWSLKPEDKFYSMDLSSATDRFPIKVQEFVLGVLIGEEKAAAWARLMVGQPFRTPEGDSLIYSVGQPMGARSSWSTFTLCHHLIVHVAAKRAGKPGFFTNYMLLGDDIVIADCSVAKHYREIMTSLGVSISNEKTHVSKDTYEFAKRWIHQGIEITGAPIRGLLENSSSAYAPVVFLETLEDRWGIQALISRSSVLSLIRIFHPTMNYAQAKFMAKRAYELSIIPRVHDSVEVREAKAFKCYDTLLFRYLGCTISEERIWLVLNQLIPMIRIGMIEKAIKECFQSVVQFRQKAVIALLKQGDIPEIGLSQEQAIQTADLHPSVAVGLAFARDQQGQIDQMNSWIESAEEEKVLDFPPTIGFHPEKAFLQSREQAQNDIRSKIPKGLKVLVKMGITRVRLATRTDDPSLLAQGGIDLSLMDGD